MATKYLRITELQPPFDIGVLDENHRAVWSFNILAKKEPSATFQRELAKILVDAAVGTFEELGGGDIFCGANAVIPKGDGPYLQILASGGLEGIRTQNQKAPAVEQPNAQITVRAKSAEAAEAMSRAAYAALLNVRNTTVVPV